VAQAAIWGDDLVSCRRQADVTNSAYLDQAQTLLGFKSFDEEYVRCLTDGDRQVEEHFARYFGRLLRLKLRVRLRNSDAVDDVAQETMTRVLVILRQGEGVRWPDRLQAFVNSVCNHVILERIREDRRLTPLDDHVAEMADPSVDLDAQLVSADLRRTIAEALNGLREKDRDILKALYLDEISSADVCRRYQVGPNYLRVLAYRAKARFRPNCQRVQWIICPFRP